MKLTRKRLQALEAICERCRFVKSEALRLRYETNRDLEKSHGAAYVRELRRIGELGCLLQFAVLFGRAPSASEQASFSRTLNELEAMGLVTRVFMDNDRRASHVRPTEAGWKCFTQTQEAAA